MPPENTESAVEFEEADVFVSPRNSIAGFSITEQLEKLGMSRKVAQGVLLAVALGAVVLTFFIWPRPVAPVDTSTGVVDPVELVEQYGK
ncbi:hypothetical protein COU17_01120 [Candidatus Kaiserbacteria bacterium CG10_big_fil_rev_8_21_14_0_10_49_17]|uniref:Uncharacterized protein n=1 Tax=Candidatus Kaiserbacteria bacterium CG10_big_fil_rev_8_21_14_0_10_49_17 TaxID=1974609 RepID=A0A2M6WF07_9BACT|nr:MAG: hypothetical protein COU17_01120 [Candidatus Kaiserbacteria bacterium CG10_big_fil_rev_8_21_14_0_10_49_17]